MVQTTIHINKDQKERISNLPRNVSFSELIRNSFDDIMFEYENKDRMDIKAA